jgi:hypothetical protein
MRLTVLFLVLLACVACGGSGPPAGVPTAPATIGSEPGKELARDVARDLRNRHPTSTIAEVTCNDFTRITQGVEVSCTGVIDGRTVPLTVRFANEFGYYELIEGTPSPTSS